VIHDILTTLRRRYPAISVLIYPVPVQGADAAPKIAEMIRLADFRRECDALILARGGGSLEDLWAFNEEVVARAIHDCQLPIVSSIGHETDFTIADFVSDARAPTPTAAAEMLSPSAIEIQRLFEGHERHLIRLVAEGMARRAQTIDYLGRRLVHPGQRIGQTFERLSVVRRRLQLAARNRISLTRNRHASLQARLRNSRLPERIQAQQKLCRELARRLYAKTSYVQRSKYAEFISLSRRLNTLNPLETLHRGFAILYKEDERTVVSSVKELAAGDEGYIQLFDGKAACSIKHVYDKAD
jgi:exodeoxyribonuclease VII large subunit